MTTSPQPDREPVHTLGAAGGRDAEITADLGRGPLPARVEVLLGGHWTTTTAHTARHGRRGPQVLIGHAGRLIWISLDRVRRPAEPQPPPSPQARSRPGVIRHDDP
jgi:hypothetical protein